MEVEAEWVHKWTLDDYHRMIASGVFDDSRVELLEGYIVAMSPQSAEHARILRVLNEIFVLAARGRFQVGPQTPLTLAHSEPEPDLSIVVPTADRHPSTAVLVVEISNTTLRKDLGIKARLYAEGDVSEYWVIDTDGRRVHVHRDPDPGAMMYRSITVVSDGTLQPLALPETRIDLAELFAAGRGA